MRVTINRILIGTLVLHGIGDLDKVDAWVENALAEKKKINRFFIYSLPLQIRVVYMNTILQLILQHRSFNLS